MDELRYYVILLSNLTDARMTEELIRAHVAHLERLEEAGQLVLCGPFADYKGGMVIIRAGSHDEARVIAESDPFVARGAERYELRTLEVSNRANNQAWAAGGKAGSTPGAAECDLRHSHEDGAAPYSDDQRASPTRRGSLFLWGRFRGCPRLGHLLN